MFFSVPSLQLKTSAVSEEADLTGIETREVISRMISVLDSTLVLDSVLLNEISEAVSDL